MVNRKRVLIPMVCSKYGWVSGSEDIGVVLVFEIDIFQDVNKYERRKSNGYIWSYTLEGGANDIVLEKITKCHFFDIFDIFGGYVEIACEKDTMEYK